MANALRTNQVRTVLNRLFAAAAQDDGAPRWREPGVSSETASAQERADASESTYMPISPQGGDLLYILVRAERPSTVVEFGTSYGISTIYLATAVADNGTGHVVSTELSAVKVVAARANLTEARVADRVTILHGDAMSTLHDIPAPVDFVLLDGWKDLCLPVLRSLESRLAVGALIVADDINLPYALRRRAMCRTVPSNAAVQNQADNRLGNLSRDGGFRFFGASDRIPSTRRGTHPREQRVFDQQSGLEHCN
jgi:predicted O-methyltransferase YrrM